MKVNIMTESLRLELEEKFLKRKINVTGTGIAQCSPKDNYCKKIGVDLAPRRALNKDEKTIS
jgi:hypothetical protein